MMTSDKEEKLFEKILAHIAASGPKPIKDVDCIKVAIAEQLITKHPSLLAKKSALLMVTLERFEEMKDAILRDKEERAYFADLEQNDKQRTRRLLVDMGVLPPSSENMTASSSGDDDIPF